MGSAKEMKVILLDIESRGLFGIIHAVEWFGFKNWLSLSWKLHKLATGRDIFEQPMIDTMRRFFPLDNPRSQK